MVRKKKPEPEPSEDLELALAPLGLEGKKAAEPEIVRWVSRNIDSRSPRPSDCPDPFAWTLLRHCRSDPAFCVFFIEKLWSKLIPSRSQLDTGAHGDLDGQPTIDLIERIQRISAIARGEDPDAPLASKKKRSAFEDYDPKAARG